MFSLYYCVTHINITKGCYDNVAWLVPFCANWVVESHLKGPSSVRFSK